MQSQNYGDVVGGIIENIMLVSNNIVRNVMIEFLTINFYKFLTTDMNILFKFEVYSFLKTEKLAINKSSRMNIIDNVEAIEYNTKTLLLNAKFKLYFLHHYRYLLNRDVELLINSILSDIERHLFKRIDELKGLKVAEKRAVKDNEEDYSAYYLERSSVCQLLNTCPCTPIYCPNLLYEKPRQGKKRTCCGSAKVDGSFVNKFIKTISGFIFSFAFIALLYVFIRFQHGTKVEIGVSVICGLGAVIVLGMSFNSTVRAYTLLMLPFCASFKGRLIVSYFALTIARKKIYGNYEWNLGSLKFALTCMMKIIDEQLTQLNNVGGFIGGVFKAIKWLKYLGSYVAQGIEAIKHLLKEVIDFVKEAFKFVTLLLSVCSDSFGRPMFLCFEMIDERDKTKCSGELSLTSFVCTLSNVALRVFCVLLLYLQFICAVLKIIFSGLIFIFKTILSAVWDSLFAGIFGKFSEVFDFTFNRSSEYSYYEFQDKSMTRVAIDIALEYKYRFEYAVDVLKTIDYIFPVVIFYLIIESWWYTRNYNNHIEFDNFVISVNFEKLDQKRFGKGFRTLLPLRQRLKDFYTRVASVRYTQKEGKRMGRAIALFFVVLLPILYMIGMDFLMINVYGFVRTHAFVRTDLSEVIPGSTNVGLRIDGTGFMASLYKFLYDQFSEIAKANVTIDTMPCLPEVNQWDRQGYILVSILMGVLMIGSIFNPCILRMRAIILGTIYTRRDEERAIWLYNHIIVKERPFFFSPLMAMRHKDGDRPNILLHYIRALIVCVYDMVTFVVKALWKIIKIALVIISYCPCWSFICVPCCFILKICCKFHRFFNPKWYVKHLKTMITYLCLAFNKISCNFCGRGDIGLEFQLCLNEKCQKRSCFDCYSRFYNECPFCILRSKNKSDSDSDEDSLVYDSSDDEEEIFIKNVDKENKPMKKPEANSNPATMPATTPMATKTKDFVEEIQGNKRMYIKALNRIQEKKMQRSVMKPRSGILEGLIENRMQHVFDLLVSDKKYEYTIANFKTVIMNKKDIHEMFGHFEIDFYQDLGESIFDNIVKAIEIDEYFSMKDITNAIIFPYLHSIEKSLSLDSKK